MQKLAGDLLLGPKFVKLEILSTSFIDFLHDKLRELRSTIFWAYGVHVQHPPTYHTHPSASILPSPPPLV